tara:strand:+ start:2689 stop:3672 length:984 start_codon:yes stop_codon:yes gene_type:complete
MNQTNTVIKTKKQLFIEKYPKFDLTFYKNAYSDLNDLTDDQLIKHYEKNGKKENRRICSIYSNSDSNFDCEEIPFESIIPKYSYYSVSDGLSMFNTSFSRKFSNLHTYKGNNDFPCIFFGVYTDKDMNYIKNHIQKNVAYIVWGGEDANINKEHSRLTVLELSKFPNLIHISISKCIKNSLDKMGVNSILVKFNLLNKNIFWKIKFTTENKSIYIYNGWMGGNREHIYGKHIYDQIIKRIKGVPIIMSNKINVPKEKMMYIYSKCFIALRLTEHDGNSNTSQECEYIGLPIVHNFCNNGLRWKNADDVINHIQNSYHRLFGQYLLLN